jgi:SecD/SecF fusion protein
MNFQGRHLATVSLAFDELARPCVSFTNTEQGAKILAAITSANLPDPNGRLRRRLGIILDDQLISAPAIMSTIRNRGQITGNFTREEVELLVAVLQAGELPAALCKQPVKTIEVEPREAAAVPD